MFTFWLLYTAGVICVITWASAKILYRVNHLKYGDGTYELTLGQKLQLQREKKDIKYLTIIILLSWVWPLLIASMILSVIYVPTRDFTKRIFRGWRNTDDETDDFAGHLGKF